MEQYGRRSARVQDEKLKIWNIKENKWPLLRPLKNLGLREIVKKCQISRFPSSAAPLFTKSEKSAPSDVTKSTGLWPLPQQVLAPPSETTSVSLTSSKDAEVLIEAPVSAGGCKHRAKPARTFKTQSSIRASETVEDAAEFLELHRLDFTSFFFLLFFPLSANKERNACTPSVLHRQGK